MRALTMLHADMDTERLALAPGAQLGGRELLRVQGLDYDADLLDTFSERGLTDLAGNAFASTCILTSVIAVRSTMEFETPSEAEEHIAIDDLLNEIATAE
ncbi:unnamed protein product [Polarella glacialis]|uniref:Uncharacterized protein n=1 Tax=Polarella glacialis TaxID=89957 RepID=A0A813ENT6_POLGL|nr:unnamed protein product [Polarella glacialis]